MFKKFGSILSIIFLGLLLSVVYINMEGSLFTFDNERHYAKIIGQCDQINWNECEEYPPMYSWIAQFFVNNTYSFMLFNFFLTLIVFPIAISFITKNWDFGLLFLLFSNVGILTLNVGTYPTLLALILWTIFYLNKNPYIRIFLLIIGTFVHNGIYLALIATWLLEYLVKLDWKNILPISSPFTFNFDLNKILIQLPDTLDLYFKSGFIISYLIGLKQFLIEKKYELIILFFISLILSISILRTIYFAIFIAMWGFAKFYEQQDNSTKYKILGIGIIYKIFMVYFILEI